VERRQRCPTRPAAGLLVEALVLGTVVVPAFLLRLIDESLGDTPAKHSHLGPGGDLDGDGVVLLVDGLQGAEDPARRHHLVPHLQALEEALLLALARAVGPKEQEVENPTEEDKGEQQAKERAAGRRSVGALGEDLDHRGTSSRGRDEPAAYRLSRPMPDAAYDSGSGSRTATPRCE
jgi:hypothetical protein